MHITYIYGCNNFLSSAPLSSKGIYYDVMPTRGHYVNPEGLQRPAKRGAGSYLL